MRGVAIGGLVAAAGFTWLLPGALAAQAGTLVFADGFESADLSAWSCTSLGCGPPPACPQMTITPGTVNVPGWGSLPQHTFTWSDAGCNPRAAVMVDQRSTGAGYMRQYTYRVSGTDRACTGVAANGGAIQGTGYVENHLGNGQGPSTDDWTVSTPGTWSLVLDGPHHKIIEYAMPNHTLPTPFADGSRTIVPTTVQWFFATGRSHPIFSVGQDATGFNGGAGNLGADSRSPYGSMNFPGDANDPGGSTELIGGVSWGDTYKFVSVAPNTSTESTLLASTDGWIDDEPNSIPYVLAWANTVDAEEGTVATSPISFQDQGRDPGVYPTSAFGQAGRNHRAINGPFPAADDWAYQMMNYENGGEIPGPGGVTSRKMAWGTNFGFLGGFDEYCGNGCGYDFHDYSLHLDSTAPLTGSRRNGMILGYSTFVVFGTHAGGYKGGTTGQAVREMENVQQATLAAVTGTVVTSGPRGVGPASGSTISYSPPGYNPIYATWDVLAAANIADATLTVAAFQPLADPIFVVHGYTTGALPASVLLNGVTAAPNVDYFASVDVAGQRLWITVLRTVSSSLELRVNP